MKRRILVTGGAGYVGRALARSLYDEHDLCIVDALRLGQTRLTSGDLAKVRFEKADIRDGEAIAAVVASFVPDVIVHLAAVHYIPDCERDPALAVATNVVGTVNLLAVCPPGCRFVFASSAAVYKPDQALHVEGTSALAPADIYGFTKLHGEQLVRYFSASHGFGAVIVRLFNVVGPGETNPHLIPDIVAQLKAGHPVIQLGNTWPRRDYIHVEDAAAGFAAAALRAKVADGESVVVNLGTSLQYSVDDIVEKLRVVTALPFRVATDATRVRAVDRPYLGADISAAHDVLGWAPRLTVDDAIRDLWQAPDFSPGLRAKYSLA